MNRISAGGTDSLALVAAAVSNLVVRFRRDRVRQPPSPLAGRRARAPHVMLVALALVFAQLGAAIHAEQHQFHPATPVCDAFFAVGGGALLPSAPPLLAIAPPPTPATGVAIAPAPFSARHEPRQSRAPPFVLI